MGFGKPTLPDCTESKKIRKDGGHSPPYRDFCEEKKMHNYFLFCLAGLFLLSGGFALGYYCAYRKYTKQYIQLRVENSYIMAGLSLSLIEALKDQKYEIAIQTLSGRVVTTLYDWYTNKDKLSVKTINYLESIAPGQYVKKYEYLYMDQLKALKIPMESL